MNKTNIVILTCYFVLGIVLTAVGWLTDIDYYSTLLFATGVALAANAAANVIREYRNTRPENREEYEKKRKEQAINLKDERKVYLRYKAAYRTMQVSILGCFFGSSILAWFRANMIVVEILFIMAVVQYVVASLIYKYFCARL
ncbi:MAG: hypothetical protein KH452_02275 [Clostridiales bacterium]|nr:hypothetical protein [Clostridiales bacterium]